MLFVITMLHMWPASSFCVSYLFAFMRTINHIILECPTFENLRVDFFSEITDTLSINDLHVDFIGLPSINKIQLLIGDHVFYENLGNILDTKGNKWLNIISISD